MNMVALHFTEAIGANGFEMIGDGAVEEDFRRIRFLVAKINFGAVPLIRADSEAIFTDCESLLWARRYDFP